MTMMSQNSHRYGQPRENCRLAPEYRSSLSRSKRGTGESGSSTVPGLLVQRLRDAGLEVLAELRPDVLGLARDHRVGALGVLLRAQRGVAAAGRHEQAATAVVGEQLALALELHAHAADPHQVDIRLQGNRLDILVDDGDLPVRRAQGRERGQSERRVDRAPAGRISFTAQRKLQKLSGKRGLISNRRIGASFRVVIGTCYTVPGEGPLRSGDAIAAGARPDPGRD